MNVIPIIKKGKKKDPGNYRELVSPGEVIEELILETISRHMPDKNVIGSSQYGFVMGKSCLTNLDSLLQSGGFSGK